MRKALVLVLWTSTPLAQRRACRAVLAVPVSAALVAAVVGWLSATYAFGFIAAGVSAAMLTFSLLAHPKPLEPARHGEEDHDPDDEGGQHRDMAPPVGPDAPSGGGEIDWERFDREFGAYAAGRELALAA